MTHAPLPIKHLPSLLATLALLAGCAAPPAPPASSDLAEVAIFAINDFHGHIQSADPVPRMIELPDPAAPGATVPVATGGAAYLASELKQLRAAHPDSITVGVGDLIGASPAGASLLDDEPVLEVLNRLGLSVSTVGNHEFDRGRADLERRIAGQCPSAGCKWPEFRGARFQYLAANAIDRASGQPFLPPYALRPVGGMTIAFIGAPLHEVPAMVTAAGIRSLRFEDEVQAINARVPEVRALGANAIVALIHQGGEYSGPYSDPTYRCPGLHGPIVDLVPRLDPAVDLVLSAHTHEGYTCKIGGRLVTQAYSYGAALTEIALRFDRRSGKLVSADAVNHLIEQGKLRPDGEMQALVERVAAVTENLRSQPVGRIARPLARTPAGGYGDSALGNLVADAQLAYARRFGPVDLAFTNSGGLRADLPSRPAAAGPVELQYGDLYAVQPFRNSIVVMTLSGAELLQILRAQWHTPDNAGNPGQPRLLQVSRTLSYRWNPDAPAAQRVVDVRIGGVPLDAQRDYRVAVNSFLANGGDRHSGFAHGRDAAALEGIDVDALRWYVETAAQAPDYRSEGRIARIGGR